jgi:hypothetical protein
VRCKNRIQLTVRDLFVRFFLRLVALLFDHLTINDVNIRCLCLVLGILCLCLDVIPSRTTSKLDSRLRSGMSAHQRDKLQAPSLPLFVSAAVWPPMKPATPRASAVFLDANSKGSRKQKQCKETPKQRRPNEPTTGKGPYWNSSRCYKTVPLVAQPRNPLFISAEEILYLEYSFKRI